MTPPSEPGPDDRDPLAAYADGDPAAVRAAAPDEPGEAQWDAVRRGIHARLSPATSAPHRAQGWGRRAAVWGACAAALTAAAAVAWVVFGPVAPQPEGAPEVTEVKPAPPEVAPKPHDAPTDPLADFAVLPMAADDDVVFLRVPGDGMFPVGVHPLAGVMSLATTEDVELDDPNEIWNQVTVSPGDAPMIFAAKRR